MAPNGLQKKKTFTAITGNEGPRIAVDKEDRCKTEQRGTCVV
jgi:hypothetical protein